ncbi:MAG: FRG domain-containing protein [Fibrobacter sp.]|uniref:FRG domain-containing protein n=1 Tax=Fibrobacter sp. TaxID=35828 RepID=UPI002A9086DB|nr:FRG domain-containing protein [Fibrobacter sp.]MDY6264989.1 FRG domain-containing protein [Fibrobacter sp.]
MNEINTANISEIKDIIQPSYDRLCRGQSDKDWALDCSFFRNKSEKYITCEELFGKTWTQSDNHPYKTSFPQVFDNGAINFFPHLGLLVQLQQNQRSTPLLDVSYDIYMPLFCACGEGRENMDKDGKIFVIECLDYAGVSDDLDNSEMQVLTNQIIPIFNNRMQKQAGAMIKTSQHMNAKSCFCDISKAGNKKVSEYIIPEELKPAILKNLAQELNVIDLGKYFYGKDNWE